jgi:hypothetical protein
MAVASANPSTRQPPNRPAWARSNGDEASGRGALTPSAAIVLTEDEALVILTFLLCVADISLVEPTYSPTFG